MSTTQGYLCVISDLTDECNDLRAALAERDAKLAALEKQEPVAWMNNKRDMTYFGHYNKDDLPLFAAAGAAPALCVVLTPEERAAFERFHETWEDNEGYDVPKEMMRRLAEVGVVHHITAGRYDITKFGHYVLAAGAAPVPNGHRLVSVEALTKWRNAFAEELSAWDIDPPLHHVQTSHDEISAMLAAAPKELS